MDMFLEKFGAELELLVFIDDDVFHFWIFLLILLSRVMENLMMFLWVCLKWKIEEVLFNLNCFLQK